MQEAEEIAQWLIADCPCRGFTFSSQHICQEVHIHVYLQFLWIWSHWTLSATAIMFIYPYTDTRTNIPIDRHRDTSTFKNKSSILISICVKISAFHTINFQEYPRTHVQPINLIFVRYLSVDMLIKTYFSDIFLSDSYIIIIEKTTYYKAVQFLIKYYWHRMVIKQKSLGRNYFIG